MGKFQIWYVGCVHELRFFGARVWSFAGIFKPALQDFAGSALLEELANTRGVSSAPPYYLALGLKLYLEQHTQEAKKTPTALLDGVEY
ncbi:hypothetical protein NM688_g6828 [Phlebia brevispora]|uniref:Uncharacterized protein n=1 Tax=Phlebia brevispora TaxID=194682 RepID=A0ACC1SC02_9APHY|nr:hypothetical protein NM688_g6828 [Phlebia brevispora]